MSYTKDCIPVPNLLEHRLIRENRDGDASVIPTSRCSLPVSHTSANLQRFDADCQNALMWWSKMQWGWSSQSSQPSQEVHPLLSFDVNVKNDHRRVTDVQAEGVNVFVVIFPAVPNHIFNFVNINWEIIVPNHTSLLCDISFLLMSPTTEFLRSETS